MTAATRTTAGRPATRLRSTWAVLAGVLLVVVLSTVTDQILHVLHVYPPWGQPMFEPGLNLLALSYRIVFTILGAWLTARLAPYAPMRHVWIYGAVGLVLGTLGAVATIPKHWGPNWYPILLVVTALPCAWAGGAWFRATHPTHPRT
jgi:hypothetical protein